MPAQVVSSIENNFTKGLITEFTGLNFPENAATDTDNCIYTLVGDVTRRDGIDYEVNYQLNGVNRTLSSISSYKWNNVSGDGSTQICVTQVGAILYFYLSSSSTVTSPLSSTLISSTINLNSFLVSGSTANVSDSECQFADGNGYLFVYHPSCEPFYVTYVSGVLTGTAITIQVRDFTGVPDGLVVNQRVALTALGSTHVYNLLNQGWGSSWNTTSATSMLIGLGSKTMTVTSTTLPIAVGDIISVTNSPGVGMQGSVTSYVGTTLTFLSTVVFGSGTFSSWNIIGYNNYLTKWAAALGSYPSNADVWWTYIDSTQVFNPAVMINLVAQSTTPAPKGHQILNAFKQQRFTALATIPDISLPDVTTSVRPRTGTWFQGRVWYTGVDASALVNGVNYSWTENIYFSQIVKGTSDFGHCYQTNDPTSPGLFSLLPSDGGVIQIQGCGSIYKLFALQNALLIFAANGVWYLTGSSGIGFTANDYTIVKLSSVQSISSTSVVDVQGMPMFWNEEGIYAVEPAKQGTSLLNSPLHVNPLEVIPVTLGTILTFFNSIPLKSKKYVRGAYHPIDYIVQWTYRSTNETGLNDRYLFDRVLNYNVSNKAFYPYTIKGTPTINGILYVAGPGGSSSPVPTFKYLTTVPQGSSYGFTFSEENNTGYVDWFTNDGVGVNFNSFFVTGFKLHGQGQKIFQIPYIYTFSRTGSTPVSYRIQGIWDYATSGHTGRWSTAQLVNINSPNFGMVFRRHRIRGQGLVLQIKVSSVSGQAFDIMGWSTFETVNQGV